MNIYQENGYKDRMDYLSCLSAEYDLDEDQVMMLADLLGPTEDFDGLISSLQDMEGY